MATKLFEMGAADVLYVVDLSSYLLRAYHAVAPLSSPSGEPTHAVHGTITMLERLFRERKPHLLYVAMDSGRETFRRELYPEYKANRPPAPDDLRVQIRRTESIVRAWGLAVEKQAGVEADDLIASVVKCARADGLRVVIVSADKDLMQLVKADVLMWDTLRNKVFGVEEVTERFQVPPSLLGDLLALMGDSSDNIPGVPSIGPKTAAALLTEYGNLDGIYASLEKIKRGKLQETLRTHEAAARLSRTLVELKDDCPVDTRRETLAFSQEARRDEPVLAAIYQELGFTRLLAALGKPGAGTSEAALSLGSAPVLSLQSLEPRPLNDGGTRAADLTSPRSPSAAEVPTTTTSNKNECVLDDSGFEALLLAVKSEIVALELHTLRPDAHRGPVISACISTRSGSYYLPFGHRYVGVPTQLSALQSLTRLCATLADGEGQLVVHDLKRTLVLLHEVCQTGDLPIAYDTMLGSYLLDPERTHSVEALGAFVGEQLAAYDDISKHGRKKRTFDELELEPASAWAAPRTTAILSAWKSQKQQLRDLGLEQLLTEVEMPLARFLAELEERGVQIDVGKLGELEKICKSELKELEAEAYRAVGKEFNLNSPKQLEAILFDELGLKPQKRTKTSRSTDAQTLETLADEHPLPHVVLQYRQIAKLKGTYIDALPALVNPKTGRIHGAWEQAVTATGRLSSTDPNLQNIPIRSELGRKIREAFTARPGHQIVSADYSQIELRVLAHLSLDERLLEAFRTGQDVHARTAMDIFEVAEDQVTREMRSRAKAVNFGVIYGQGESGLARATGISRAEAAQFIAAYFRRYDGVQSFMDRTLEQARRGEGVSSMLGRRRSVPDIKSGNRARRLAAERIAMNMPIQGSAADILKLAMLRLREPVTPGTKMVLTVHDELVFEVPTTEVEEASRQIAHEMQSAIQLEVPLIVDVGHGPNWNVAH